MTNPDFQHSLDPVDWGELRRDGHRMLDDMFDHLQTLREQPVWRAPTPARLGEIREALPRAPTPLADVHAQFLRAVLPYSSGNAHPGFMGWVQGGGTPVGMLAEMLAAGMNAKSRRSPPHGDRGRASNGRMDTRPVWLSVNRQWSLRNGHIGRQLHGRACRAHASVWPVGARPGRGRDRTQTDCLHLRGGAWLRRPRDGDGGTRP